MEINNTHFLDVVVERICCNKQYQTIVFEKKSRCKISKKLICENQDVKFRENIILRRKLTVVKTNKHVIPEEFSGLRRERVVVVSVFLNLTEIIVK